jgi:PTH1 family peptidyl-tRNA hydrolase
MMILIGLGNPGAKYARNRHNVGFRAADAIAARHGFGPEKQRFQSLAREGVVETEAGPTRCLLLKPQTFYNETGRAARAAADFYKLGPDAITAFHDELDLAPGKVRVKTGGGAAGNNGMRSMTAALGPDFQRVRIGIGHPGKEKVLSHALSDFSAAEEAWLDPLVDAIARSLDLLAAGKPDAFQTRVAHLAPAPPCPDWLKRGRDGGGEAG